VPLPRSHRSSVGMHNRTKFCWVFITNWYYARLK